MNCLWRRRGNVFRDHGRILYGIPASNLYGNDVCFPQTTDPASLEAHLTAALQTEPCSLVKTASKIMPNNLNNSDIRNMY